MEQNAEREISIVDFINKGVHAVRFLFSKWLIILLVAFVVGLLGILYAWFKKPVYTAEMSFTAETESGGKLSAYAGIAAQFGFDLGGGSNNIFEGDNLAELLKSRTLIKKTLLSASGKGSNLMIEEYLIEGIDKLREKGIVFTPDRIGNDRQTDSVLNAVCEGIAKKELDVFRKDKKLSIIIIRMSGGNEWFCKRFVDLLAANAIQFYTDYKSRKAKQNVEILQRQTDSVRAMLFGSISDVAAINDLNINPTRQALKTPSQRRQVDVQVNGTLYGELLKNLELSKLALRKETPLIQIIDTPEFPLPKKKPGRLFTGISFAFIGAILCSILLIVINEYKKYKVRNL